MIAVRTLVYFILSSLLNAVLGVVLVLLIHPGNPGIRKSIATSHNGRAVNILDSLLDLGRWYYISFSRPLFPLPFSSENRALSLSIIDQLVISVLLRRHVKGTHEPFPRNFPTIKVESFARRGTSNARLVPLCSTTGKEYETYLRLFFIDLYPSPFVREGRMTKSNILWATILWETGR